MKPRPHRLELPLEPGHRFLRFADRGGYTRLKGLIAPIAWDHRMGQTQAVNAYRMICSESVEEMIVELQKSKRDLADAIVSQNKSLIGQLTAQDLQDLLG